MVREVLELRLAVLSALLGGQIGEVVRTAGRDAGFEEGVSKAGGAVADTDSILGVEAEGAGFEAEGGGWVGVEGRRTDRVAFARIAVLAIGRAARHTDLADHLCELIGRTLGDAAQGERVSEVVGGGTGEQTLASGGVAVVWSRGEGTEEHAEAVEGRVVEGVVVGGGGTVWHTLHGGVVGEQSGQAGGGAEVVGGVEEGGHLDGTDGHAAAGEGVADESGGAVDGG